MRGDRDEVTTAMSEDESAKMLSAPADGVPDVIATQADLVDAANSLMAGWGPIALDAERASGIRYGQRAFLIQLRRAGVGTQLIDPVDMVDFTPLATALESGEWILHAATQDLPCLAELGLRPKSLFDTELAGRLLGYPKVGLASLTEQLLGLQLAKTHGAADWSRRPLPPAWLNYAALDVELLHELRAIVLEELIQTGRISWAEEEFAALLTFEPRIHAEPWRRISGLHKVRDPERMAIARSLWQERERVAKQVDRAPGRVLPDSALIAAAQASPANLKGLSEVAEFARHRRRLTQWWEAIERAYELDDDELPGPPEADGPPPKRTWDRRNPEAAERLNRLRPFVVDQAADLGIAPEILISPDLVRRLAWEPPASVDEAVIREQLIAGGARPWQAERVAAGLAERLSR